MKKAAALLTIALLISLVGCSGNAGADEVPSPSTIESQTSSETPETPPVETMGMVPTQDPSQSEEPAEATQEPAESEEPPEETIAPTIEPTKQPEQTSPPASSAPVSAPVPVPSPASVSTPTPMPTPAPTPAHTHSYTSTVTKQATCKAEGVRTYNCSCGDSYTEAIGKTNDHDWATRHIAEVGHMESNGTHRVMFIKCGCGFIVNSDQPNGNELYEAHDLECPKSCIYWWEDVPNGEDQYVIDTPAHDETYCTICGITQ